MGLFTGSWSGVPNIIVTIFLGYLLMSVAIVYAHRKGKQYAPMIIIGLMGGLQVFVSFTSAKFVNLTLADIEFFIVAGSFIYPILPLGDDFLNEFYGKETARTSVYAQFFIRILTTIYLVWLVYLPNPTGNEANYEMFSTMAGIVPRVAISSIIATYIGAMINVHVFAGLKKKTGGKFLWLRTSISTITDLTVNAVIFTFLAFSFVVPVANLFSMIFVSVAIRFLTSFLELIFLYGMTYMRNNGKLEVNTLEVIPVHKQGIAS